MDFYGQFEIVPFKWLKILTKQSIFWIILDQPECQPQMMHQKELFFAVSWGKWYDFYHLYLGFFEPNHWVGLRENLQETPIFNGKNYGFL